MKQMLKLLSQLSNVENRCYNQDLVLVFTNRFWLSDLVKNVRWGVQEAHFDTPIWLLSVLEPCDLRINTAVFHSQYQIHSKSRGASLLCECFSLSINHHWNKKEKILKIHWFHLHVQAQQINDNNTLHLRSLSIRLLWSQQPNGKPLT
jgi:hypothetical protein